MAGIDSDLIRGHIDTIILKSLYHGDKYGLEIIQEIEDKSNGAYELKQPTLYSCLKRLEGQGLISSYWEDSEIGGKRHYYTLTEQGKETYQNNQKEWARSKEIIDTLIDNTSAPQQNLNDSVEDETQVNTVFDDNQEDSTTEVNQEDTSEPEVIEEDEENENLADNAENVALVEQQTDAEDESLSYLADEDQQDEFASFDAIETDSNSTFFSTNNEIATEDEFEELDSDELLDSQLTNNELDQDIVSLTLDEIDELDESDNTYEDTTPPVNEVFDIDDEQPLEQDTDENETDEEILEPFVFDNSTDTYDSEDELVAADNTYYSNNEYEENVFTNEYTDDLNDEITNFENTFDDEIYVSEESSLDDDEIYNPEPETPFDEQIYSYNEPEDESEEQIWSAETEDVIEDEPLLDETEEPEEVTPVVSPTYINFDSHKYDEVDITSIEHEELAAAEDNDSLTRDYYSSDELTLNESPEQEENTSALPEYPRASQEAIENLYKTTENYGNLQAGYTDETYKQMLNELETYGSSNKEQVAPTKNKALKLSELTEKFEEEGIVIRRHEKQVKESNDTKIYIKSNKIKMITNWITCGATTFALLVVFLIMNAFKESYTFNFAFWQFAVAFGVSLLIPLYSTIQFWINPYKKAIAKFAPRLSILISILITVQIILITYCINVQLGFYSFSQDNYNHLLWILPLIISFTPIIQTFVYMPLYNSKEYHI